MGVVFFLVEVLTMLTDFSLGYFLSIISFYATNDWMWGLNIPNGSYWHEYYDRLSYYYKKVIIYGAVGIISWDMDWRPRKEA